MQLHSVNGRNASDDRIILPLSSMSEVFGVKDRSIFSKMFRNGTSFQHTLKSVEKELGAQATRTPIGAIRNSIRVKCRIFLQSNGFIKFGTINGPMDVVRSFLNIPQDISVLVMPRALNTGLKNGTQYSQSLHPDSSSFSKGENVSISDSIETKHGFFWHARHVVQFCIWLAHCLSLSLSKGDSLFPLHVPQDFHE